MKHILILLPFILGINVSAFPSEFYSEKLAEKMVKIVLKEKNLDLVKKLEINTLLEKTEPLVIYQFKKEEKTFYAIFTQAKGRYDYFDYLVLVNETFAIDKVRVLKYRSENGGEIASKKWLEQFENYSTGELRYKKEISALSGATISATSIVADIPKVLEILKLNCN